MIILETKHIEFGDGDIGTGSLIRKDGTGVLCFSDLDKKYEIGEQINDKKDRNNIIVSLHFKKVESIDVVIEALERIKKLMLKEQETSNENKN